MRTAVATFVLSCLTPLSAAACTWTRIPSAPAEYVVVGNAVAGIIACFYTLRGNHTSKHLPMALTFACFWIGVAAAVHAAPGGDWSDFAPAVLAAVGLVIPYLAMRFGRRRRVLIPMLAYTGVMIVFSISAFEGSGKTFGSMPPDYAEKVF